MTTKYSDAKKWRENHPEKIKAHRLIYCGIRNGSIIKKPCKECGKEKSEAHHTDYSKPYNIIWLCKYHHTKRHYK